ncbi:MAG: ABC transporter permease [Euryarchaeota archaeon]|nr:ABC transporter permease [Euryarchaeota archaeon]
MWFRTAWEVGKKELLHLRRDRKSIGLTIILPLVAMMSFALAYGDTDVLGISEHRVYPIGFQNFDRGPEGDILIAQFKALETEAQEARGEVQTVSFEVTELLPTDDPEEPVRQGDLYGVIVIPENFTGNLRADGRQAYVFLIGDNTKALIAENLEKFTRVLLDEAQGKAFGRPPLQEPPATLIQTRHLLSSDVGQLAVFYPGIIALLTAFASLNDIATSITRERTEGTLGHVFITPMHRSAFLTGKLGAGVFLGLLRGLLLLLVGIYGLGLVMAGSWFVFFIIVALVALATLGIGLIVAALATTERSVLVATLLITIVFMFLIGALTPVEYMLPTSQFVALSLPPTYGVDALRRVMLLGQGFTNVGILVDIGALVIGSVVTLVVGAVLFSKRGLGIK